MSLIGQMLRRGFNGIRNKRWVRDNSSLYRGDYYQDVATIWAGRIEIWVLKGR
jgi:hypothetical protein